MFNIETVPLIQLASLSSDSHDNTELMERRDLQDVNVRRLPYQSVLKGHSESPNTIQRYFFIKLGV